MISPYPEFFCDSLNTRNINLSDLLPNRGIVALPFHLPLELYKPYLMFVVANDIKVTFGARGSYTSEAIFPKLCNTLIFDLSASDIVGTFLSQDVFQDS